MVIDVRDLIVTIVWGVVALAAIQIGGMYAFTRLFLYGPMFKTKREREHTYEPMRGDFSGSPR